MLVTLRSKNAQVIVVVWKSALKNTGNLHISSGDAAILTIPLKREKGTS
jgi:hypothetical protein